MKKQTMISVIIPIYNAANYLADLLEGVLRQTYSHLEIILVNDGSSDNCNAIIESFKNRDQRIRYYQIAHQGVSAARNLGLEHATGKYIRFLDADDSLAQDSMEKMLSAMENDEDIDLAIGRFYSDHTKIAYYGPKELDGKTSIRDFIRDFSVSSKTFFYSVVWNKLYKRDIITRYQIRFDEDIVWCEDFLFNLEYYRHCGYVCYIPDVIYSYKFREDSVIATLVRQIGQERIDEINRYRYQKAMSLIEEMGCGTEEYTDIWLYTALMRELNKTVSVFSAPDGGKAGNYRDWKTRYRSFTELLRTKKHVEMLHRRYVADPDLMVKVIWLHIKRKVYFPLFVLFIMKDFASVHCPWIKRVWNKRKRQGNIL